MNTRVDRPRAASHDRGDVKRLDGSLRWGGQAAARMQLEDAVYRCRRSDGMRCEITPGMHARRSQLQGADLLQRMWAAVRMGATGAGLRRVDSRLTLLFGEYAWGTPMLPHSALRLSSILVLCFPSSSSSSLLTAIDDAWLQHVCCTARMMPTCPVKVSIHSRHHPAVSSIGLP